MKLLRAEIQGFRSFAKPQTINFEAMRPGLYHLAGRNEVEPELEANGAGKSSLLEAIYWALYGCTSRGVRAAAVKNWHSKEKCAVILSLQAAGGLLDVFRMWQPNSLEVSHGGGEASPVDQGQLEQLVGIPRAAFLRAIYFAQFTPAFVDLDPREQTEIFTQVLNLQVWEQAADRSTTAARQSEDKIQKLKERLAYLDGQVKELLAADYVAQERAWAADHKVKVDTAKGATTVAQAAVAGAKREITAARAGSEKFRARRKQVEDHALVVSSLDRDCRRLSDTIASLQAKDIKKCPTCGQPVSNAHIQKELHTAKTAQIALEAEAKKAVAKHEALLKDMALYRNEEVKQLDAEKKLAVAEERLTSSHSTLAYLVRELNPHTAARAAADKRGEELADELDKNGIELTANERGAAAAQFWTKGFKEIRLSEIRASLDQLTVESNEMLFQLGLPDWAIEFDVERETKSGTISKNFTTMVRAPHTKEIIPWEAFSGGESQRLRLSIAMGFSNLICSRLGTQPNVEMYDEPSTWLSEAGIQDLLSVLADRAQRQKKVILLADHRALEFGGFAGVITVVKDKEGSHIEM